MTPAPRQDAEQYTLEMAQTLVEAPEIDGVMLDYAPDTQLDIARMLLAAHAKIERLKAQRQAAFDLIGANGCDCDEDEGPMPEDLASHRCLAGRIEAALTDT